MHSVMIHLVDGFVFLAQAADTAAAASNPGGADAWSRWTSMPFWLLVVMGLCVLAVPIAAVWDAFITPVLEEKRRRREEEEKAAEEAAAAESEESAEGPSEEAAEETPDEAGEEAAAEEGPGEPDDADELGEAPEPDEAESFNFAFEEVDKKKKGG